jgi:hypothetical protein
MGLAALVTTQLAQTLLAGRHSRLVVGTSNDDPDGRIAQPETCRRDDRTMAGRRFSAPELVQITS